LSRDDTRNMKTHRCETWAFVDRLNSGIRRKRPAFRSSDSERSRTRLPRFYHGHPAGRLHPRRLDRCSGRAIPLRHYQAGVEERRGILYHHGGGFVLAARQPRHICAELCRRTGYSHIRGYRSRRKPGIRRLRRCMLAFSSGGRRPAIILCRRERRRSLAARWRMRPGPYAASAVLIYRPGRDVDRAPMSSSEARC